MKSKQWRVNSEEFPKQVSRNKKRDRQGREKVPETVKSKHKTSYKLRVTSYKEKNQLQVTSYKLQDSL